MKIERLTERIWYYPFEKERDRPNLGYIRGDRWSLAVDAGHSDAHLADFTGRWKRLAFPCRSSRYLPTGTGIILLPCTPFTGFRWPIP